MNKKDYFLLATHRLVAGGEGTEPQRQPIYFIGVLLGAIAKVYYDHFKSGVDFQWGQLGVAAIVSVVTFPTIYHTSGLDRAGSVTLTRWCIAFQYGFFWQSIIKMSDDAVAHHK